MTRKTPEQRIEELEIERCKIEYELKQKKNAIAKAKRTELTKINKKKRKEDTRRKILVGSAILRKVEHGEWPKERLRVLMNNFLSKESDRQLFSLETHNTDTEQ